MALSISIFAEARDEVSSGRSKEVPPRASEVAARTSRSGESTREREGPASRASARLMHKSHDLNEGVVARSSLKKASCTWSCLMGRTSQYLHSPLNARAACSYHNHSKQKVSRSSSEMGFEKVGIHLFTESLNIAMM